MSFFACNNFALVATHMIVPNLSGLEAVGTWGLEPSRTIRTLVVYCVPEWPTLVAYVLIANTCVVCVNIYIAIPEP